MVVILYKLDASPPCRAVLMTVEILGLKIETRDVNTIAGEQFKAEYLEKNPAHTVPVIQDGNFVLADSHAIITYIVSKYGAELRSTLYPVDLNKRATIDQRLFADATLLYPHLSAIFLSVLLEKATEPNPKQVEKVVEGYGYIEKYLEKSAFLAGNHITVADISVVASISSLDALVPLDDEKFPKTKEWFEKIKAKDFYEKANAPGLEQFAGFLQSQMKENSS